MSDLTLPWEDRWDVVQSIMNALRPRCAELPPPHRISEFSSYAEQSRVPVLFGTKAGREEAIRMASQVVYQALLARSPEIGSYENITKHRLVPSYMVLKNLPVRSAETDAFELRAAAVAYSVYGVKGSICGLTAPRTGNYWVYNEDGRCIYVQPSAAAVWVTFLMRLCMHWEEDLGGHWEPPSLDKMGLKEYWGADGGFPGGYLT